jgi:hypothetical protein
MADSLARGEAPIASHLLYTQPGILDDSDWNERRKGIEAGFAWGVHADLVAFYLDHGWSDGMRAARAHWEPTGVLVDVRYIGQLQECTEVSARWCPLHGDCVCAPGDDFNDDDCPLHSPRSRHGENG